MKFITRIVNFESLVPTAVSNPLWTPAAYMLHMINLMRSDFERQGGTEPFDVIIRPLIIPFRIPIPHWEEAGHDATGFMITIAEPGVYRP